MIYTVELLTDIGWFPDGDLDGLENGSDLCRNSILTPTVVIGGVNSGVPNRILNYGCTISDLFVKIAGGSSNHDDFVANIARYTRYLRDAGIITEEERQAIINAADNSNLP